MILLPDTDETIVFVTMQIKSEILGAKLMYSIDLFSVFSIALIVILMIAETSD